MKLIFVSILCSLTWLIKALLKACEQVYENKSMLKSDQMKCLNQTVLTTIHISFVYINLLFSPLGHKGYWIYTRNGRVVVFWLKISIIPFNWSPNKYMIFIFNKPLNYRGSPIIRATLHWLQLIPLISSTFLHDPISIWPLRMHNIF